MMIEIPDSLIKKYEIIKKHSLERNKNYFKHYGKPPNLTDDIIVICDMMALYRAYHNLEVE